MSGAWNTAGSVASARVLLHTLGGDAVTLRFAALPGTGDGEELGLASPDFREVVLEPVLVRFQQGRNTVLIDAATAEAALETDQVKAVLLAASSVLLNGERFRVEAVERRAVCGRAYLYRFLLASEGSAP